MLVTATVFQSAIGPYVVVEVVGSVNQAVAAVPAFASVMAVCAAACAGSTRSRARPARRCDRHARVELHRKRHDELQTPCDMLQRGMCCIIVQLSCIIVQERAPTANKENVPQHTILQRACRDTSMHPMAKEYT